MKKVTFRFALAGIFGTAQAGVLDAVSQFYIKQAGLDRLTAVIPPAPGNKVLVNAKPLLPRPDFRSVALSVRLFALPCALSPI